jgi:predicted nucleic acid-binding protein
MILIDSNVILDIITQDKNWYDWSSKQLASMVESNELIINDIIYTEISVGFNKIEELEQVLSGGFFKIYAIPKEALFLAGKVFLKYKNTKGTKSSTLPDFFIGAHAAVKNIPLLTRDIARYKTYFPYLELIHP